jgi:hypothetical protein
MVKKQTESMKMKLMNSAIAGLIFFFGAFTDGIITQTELIAVLGTSAIIFLTKFRDAMQTKKGNFIFNFI